MRDGGAGAGEGRGVGFREGGGGGRYVGPPGSSRVASCVVWLGRNGGNTCRDARIGTSASTWRTVARSGNRGAGRSGNGGGLGRTTRWSGFLATGGGRFFAGWSGGGVVAADCLFDGTGGGPLDGGGTLVVSMALVEEIVSQGDDD